MARSLLAILGLLLALGCGGDDDSPVDAGAESGQALLDLLLEVDGDGSGLDCDTLDGVDSSELSRSGTRTLPLQLRSVLITPATAQDDADLIDTNAASAVVSLQIPADAVPDEAIEVRLLAIVESGLPCDVRLGANFTLVDVGEAPRNLPAEINGTMGPTIVSLTDVVTFEIQARFPVAAPGDITPGSWLIMRIARTGADPADTCTAQIGLIGAAIHYQAQ